MRLTRIGAISFNLFFLFSPAYAGNQKLQWKTYQYKDFGFRIQSPFLLSPQNEEKDSLILATSESDDKIIIVVFAKAHSNKALRLSEIRDTMLAIFIKAGCRNFRTSDRTVVCELEPALLTTGTYETPNASTKEMRLLSLKKGSRWWVVGVNYPRGDTSQIINAAKIIKSFKLE